MGLTSPEASTGSHPVFRPIRTAHQHPVPPPHPMSCISDKRLLERISSTVEEVALTILLDPDSEREEDSEWDSDYCDSLSTPGLAHDTTSDPQYLSRGTRGSAGRPPIGGAIAGYLKYPDRSFLVTPRELSGSSRFAA